MGAGKGDDPRDPHRRLCTPEEWDRRWVNTFGGDLVDTLENAGYEVVEGAEAVLETIKEKAQ